MQMTVNLTVKMLHVENISMHNNCLPVLFIIEWE